MATKSIRRMLISNGILTGGGELNMEVVKRFGWIVKEIELARVQK